MVRVTSFLICESIANVPTPDGGMVTHLTGPTIALRPINIPSNYSFVLTFAIQGIGAEPSINIRIVIEDPDGKTVQDTGDQELINPNFPDEMPADYGGAIINLGANNVAFNKEGCYKIKVYAKDTVIYRHELPVFKKVMNDGDRINQR